MPLRRYSKNPILKPNDNWWESVAVYNPGATVFKDKVILLYRCLGPEFVSRFGLAESSDGFHFKRVGNLPVMEPDLNDPFERLGIEDPRITKIDDSYLITYTAASLYRANESNKAAKSLFRVGVPWRIRVGLAETKDFVSFEKLGFLFPDLDLKNSALFPEKIDNKFVLLTRADPNIMISYSTNLVNWTLPEFMLGPRFEMWDGIKIGAGTPPLKTENGWLLFYHGVSENKVYSIGALLLDLANPKIVLARTKKPLLYPYEKYEKRGLTPNVVFTCGVVEWEDKYIVYYGAADQVIAAATLEKDLNQIFK